MDALKIAVVGSGISGLSAAWLLSRRHHVTLYEADDRIGGHANTVDVATPEGALAIDTGFIVYNEKNYPNLAALFGHLGVRTRPSEMSFALSIDGGRYEYATSTVVSFFGQPRNLASPRHWRLLRDMSRFFRTSRARIACYPAEIALGDFLREEGYGRPFVDDHIVPMGAAIWSTPATRMLGFPARSFVDFYANHGMLQFEGRPVWRTVSGGSGNYVRSLVADGGFEICAGAAVKRIVRHEGYVHLSDARGVSRPFDHVVVATHADRALALLDRPEPQEARLLSAFSYQPNLAVLHRDQRFMPRRRRLWSSWNYLKNGAGTEAGLSVTYWMNRLQGLPGETNFFVTLNPAAEIHPKAVDGAFEYRHPVFDAAALAAQRELWSLQGQRRTWFCGSYFGHGFHEDGAQAGLAVAEQLGGIRRPWNVEGESARIALGAPAALEAAE